VQPVAGCIRSLSFVQQRPPSRKIFARRGLSQERQHYSGGDHRADSPRFAEDPHCRRKRVVFSMNDVEKMTRESPPQTVSSSASYSESASVVGSILWGLQ